MNPDPSGNVPAPPPSRRSVDTPLGTEISDHRGAAGGGRGLQRVAGDAARAVNPGPTGRELCFQNFSDDRPGAGAIPSTYKSVPAAYIADARAGRGIAGESCCCRFWGSSSSTTLTAGTNPGIVRTIRKLMIVIPSVYRCSLDSESPINQANICPGHRSRHDVRRLSTFFAAKTSRMVPTGHSWRWKSPTAATPGQPPAISLWKTCTRPSTPFLTRSPVGTAGLTAFW